MRKRLHWIITVTLAILLLSESTLFAQGTRTSDIVGDWQGTIKVSSSASVRIVLHVTKDGSGWSATLYSIDQSPDGIPVSSVTLQDSTLKLSVDLIRVGYEGKLSADGDSIKGTWTQGQPLPLDFQRATKDTLWQRDSSPHSISFVTVDDGVKLEVLDWGGKGRPLIFLAGLGNNAHIFDKFAPKFSPAYHVYGITRRGFGASSAPAPVNGNYSADRLGDDVLAVIDSLRLSRPVLVGHSIAGEELSSIGSRYPDKVAGLVYLEAGYPYAFYDQTIGDLTIDSNELRKNLTSFSPSAGSEERKRLVEYLLQTSLPRLQQDLQDELKHLQTEPATPGNSIPPQMSALFQAFSAGEQKYTDIRVSCLAIYALPHSGGPAYSDPGLRAAAEARDLSTTGAQAKAFENGVHSSRVIRLAHANHYIFLSNEADVLREMNGYLSSLP